MGVGDLTVPKRMQAFGEAFYGRAAAYDLALTAGDEALAQALCKNILNGEGIENARRLAVYAEAAMAALGGTGRCGAAEASLEISARRRERAHCHEPNQQHDRQAAIPGAFPSWWRRSRTPDCIARSRPTRPRARPWPRSRACAKFCRRSASLDVTPEERRPLPCHRPGAGADRADLRGDARSDRERDRRGDRPDLRAAGANSRTCRSGRRGRRERRRKFPIRRSRSSTASSISAGSRPTRCSWRSIPIRAGRMRFSSRRSRPPTPRIIRLPR